MDESVALDSSKQKKFVKSVRGLKKLLKKKDKKPVDNEVLTEETKEKDVKEVKKEGKGKRKSRGLVYLSHIPHGFYEHQMTEYFKQFGVVTNARVIRSRRSGNSKGFAFVEFKEPAVAEIVAETMNNYLMGKRLIKAAYIPPNKQRKNAQRKKWNSQKNPSSDERLTFKKKHNADKNDEEELKMAKKLLKNLSKTKQKLSELGIEYDFFKPVDVPEALVDKLDEVIPHTEVKPIKLKSEEKVNQIKFETQEVIVDVNTKKRKEKQPKHKQIQNNELLNSSETLVKKITVKSDTGHLGDVKDMKINKKQQTQQQKLKEQTEEVNVDVNTKKRKKKQPKLKQIQNNGLPNSSETLVKKNTVKSDTGKLGDVKDMKINKKQQTQQQKLKEQKLKKAGVKGPENFVSIMESDGSDSSIDFDSDEFEKMIEMENDYELSSGDESSKSEGEDVQEITKTVSKKTAKGSKNRGIASEDLSKQKKHDKVNLQPQSLKRKPSQIAPVAAKKTKFEKQSRKRPLNKVIKKRK